MMRTNHAVKVDRLTCELCVSGGFPSCIHDNRIDGSTDRNNAYLTTDATNAPAKFRTGGLAESLPRTRSRPTRGPFASEIRD
jgi:hypothetical protein